jgi:hypothetical protein
VQCYGVWSWPAAELACDVADRMIHFIHPTGLAPGASVYEYEYATAYGPL